MTQLDDDLHHPDGSHRALPPDGCEDGAAWWERLRAHLAEHRRIAGINVTETRQVE